MKVSVITGIYKIADRELFEKFLTYKGVELYCEGGESALNEYKCDFDALAREFRDGNYTADMLADVRSFKDKLEEERKREADRDHNFRNMLLTTGSNFEGYRVVSYVDLVCEEVVFKNSLSSRFGAAIENLSAGFTFEDVELSGSSMLIAKARAYVTEKFRKHVADLGANAALGVEYESSYGESVVRVAIFGTAVQIEKLD